MKKVLPILALGSLAFCANAQIDPLDQFLFKTFVPSLTVYDSIATSMDTGTAFTAFATVGMDYSTTRDTEKIDTCWIEENGTLSETFKGEWSAASYTLAGFDAAAANNDTLYKYVYHRSQADQDSLIMVYADAGSGLESELALGLVHSGAGVVDEMYMMTDAMGMGTLDTMMVFDYFYGTGGRLDSIEQKMSMFGFTMLMGKIVNTYDANGRHSQMDIYSDTTGMGGGMSRMATYSFKHNSSGEVEEAIFYSVMNGNLDLEGSTRYRLRTGGTTSLTEGHNVDVALFPNPAENYLSIDSDITFNGYEIRSIDGKKLQEGDVADRHIDVQALSTGTYILRLRSDGKTVSRKFQKN